MACCSFFSGTPCSFPTSLDGSDVSFRTLFESFPPTNTPHLVLAKPLEEVCILLMFSFHDILEGITQHTVGTP